MYTASIHDPVSGTLLTLQAKTQPALCKIVSEEIDTLRSKIVDAYLPCSAAFSLIIFCFIIMADLTPFGIIVMSLLTVAYLRGAPYWINPLAHIRYLRKCMHAWEKELERISAPDTRTV